MNRLFFAGCLLFASCAVNAQSTKVPVGKKIEVSANNTATTTMTVMGQSLETVAVINALQDYTLQTVSATGYTVLFVPRKMSGSISVMGQEQKFDSEDSTVQGPPEMTGLRRSMNKPQEIKIENGQVVVDSEISKTLSAIGVSAGDLFDVSKLFLNVPAAQLKQGYSWSDSSIAGDQRVVNQYVITNVVNGQVDIRVSTDSKMKIIIKQAGIELKEDMKGFSTALRIYVNGLLLSEKVSLNMTGTAEVMGITAPMTIAATITTMVK